MRTGVKPLSESTGSPGRTSSRGADLERTGVAPASDERDDAEIHEHDPHSVDPTADHDDVQSVFLGDPADADGSVFRTGRERDPERGPVEGPPPNRENSYRKNILRTKRISYDLYCFISSY